MKRTHITALAVAVAALSAGQAMAAEPVAARTRAQVQAELADAARSGELIGYVASGQKLNEVAPHLFPAKAVAAGKTRAQVQAELVEAIRTGDVVDGATGLAMKDLTAARVASQEVGGKSREQAKAELREALRRGDVLAGGTGGRYNQLYPTSFSSSN